VWTGYDSSEFQGDVKQSVNVDGLFVSSSTFKIHIHYPPSKIPTKPTLYSEKISPELVLEIWKVFFGRFSWMVVIF